MKRLLHWTLTISLTLFSIGFLVIGSAMDPAPPEWSYEAAEYNHGAEFMATALVIGTWVGTYFSWRKLLRG